MPQNDNPISGNPYVKAFHDLMSTSKDFMGFLGNPGERQGIRQGFTDAVNRGAVAATLGAPVDMANMGLNLGKAAVGYLGNKAGVLTADQMPQLIDNPVGGSEYIGNQLQRFGMVSPNRNALAEGLAGVLPTSPTKSAKAVAAIAGGGVVPGMDLAATVWHGSPHKFPPTPNNPLGEFDFSKIGTGEGAQAYGHGGYLGGARATGEQYQKALAGKDQGMAGQIAANALRGRTPESAIDALSLNLVGVTPEARAMTQQAIDLIKQGDANQGYLYKVDLPDEAIARMLDWDKPLSQQPESVRAALTPEALGLQYQQLPNGNHAFVNAQGTRVGNMQKGGTSDSFRTNWLDSVANSGLSGREVYQSINDGMFGADKAAAALRQAGIPGIRYLDGGSRSAGQGSSNYVVFPGNENMLRILERNGQALK